MIARFAPSLVAHIFGVTPLTVATNSALIILVIYLFWRFVLKPSLDLGVNIKAVLTPPAFGALEIIPPRTIDAHPLHTQNLFSVLQQQLSKHEVVSFEIVSTRKSGIKYRVIASERHLPSIQKHFAAYLPELKFNRVPVSPESKAGTRFFIIRQSRHFAYPLNSPDNPEKTDPASFTAGSITQLQDGEEVTLQLVAKRYRSREAVRIHSRLMNRGGVLVDGKLRYYLTAYWWLWVPAVLIGLIGQLWQLGVVTVLIVWVVSSFGEHQQKELTPFEEKVSAAMEAKLNQPLFQTDIRLGVYSPTRSGTLVNDFISSLEPHNTAYHQYLRLKKQIFGSLSQRYAQKLFTHRLA